MVSGHGVLFHVSHTHLPRAINFVINVYKYCIALELIQLARLTEFNLANNLLLNRLEFNAFFKIKGGFQKDRAIIDYQQH